MSSDGGESSWRAIGVAGASSALFLFAASAAWLYWARMLSGVAIALASGAGTAWIAELLSHTERSHAALIATSANYLGLAAGSLVAGYLAQYGPSPLYSPWLGRFANDCCPAVRPQRGSLTQRRIRSCGEVDETMTVWRRYGPAIPRALRASFRI